MLQAWKLWNEGMPSQLIDPCLQGSFNLAEVIRCIHIGLLCVQQHPEDRPSMPSVILMLGSETMLRQPKQPGYLADRKSTRQDYSSSTPESCSTNTITISELEGRQRICLWYHALVYIINCKSSNMSTKWKVKINDWTKNYEDHPVNACWGSKSSEDRPILQLTTLPKMQALFLSDFMFIKNLLQVMILGFVMICMGQ